MALTHLLGILLLGAPLLLFSSAEAGEVGVNYGMDADNLPDPESVVQLLMDNDITTVRIFNADDGFLTALANTGIKVMVMMPNEEVAAAAANRSYALDWVNCNVGSYYPDTQIHGVSVGNEVFRTNPELKLLLVPAMINVQRALVKLGLADAMKVTTPLHFSTLTDTYPPSSARFRDDLAQSAMKPMLQFLQRTGSYLSMNPYPFFAYVEGINDQQNISLDYALGNSKLDINDTNTGLVYHSLLDAMMDATYYATEKLMGKMNVMQSGLRAGSTLPTQWPETSWPHGGLRVNNQKNTQRYDRDLLKGSNGFPTTVANAANAETYNNYVINRVLCGRTGTPYRPQADMDIYIFDLFDENKKGVSDDPGDVERYFGLFSLPDMTKNYDFDFHCNDD